MAEIEGGKVEEVDDEDELGPDKVIVHPEEHEDELRDVSDDVVGAKVGGASGPRRVAGEEGVEVAELGGEEGNPKGIMDVSKSLHIPLSHIPTMQRLHLIQDPHALRCPIA